MHTILVNVFNYFQSVADALDDIITKEEPAAKSKVPNKPVVKVGTEFDVECPECGGRVNAEVRSEDKRYMTVYGHSGVRHVLHTEHRCVEPHCRTGYYHGYRVLKGGKKMYEENCLDPQKVFLGLDFLYKMFSTFSFLVVSGQTAFDIDFLFNTTLKIYHHNATFDGLSSEFNDYFSNGKSY